MSASSRSATLEEQAGCSFRHSRLYALAQRQQVDATDVPVDEVLCVICHDTATVDTFPKWVLLGCGVTATCSSFLCPACLDSYLEYDAAQKKKNQNRGSAKNVLVKCSVCQTHSYSVYGLWCTQNVKMEYFEQIAFQYFKTEQTMRTLATPIDGAAMRMLPRHFQTDMDKTTCLTLTEIVLLIKSLTKDKLRLERRVEKVETDYGHAQRRLASKEAEVAVLTRNSQTIKWEAEEEATRLSSRMAEMKAQIDAAHDSIQAMSKQILLEKQEHEEREKILKDRVLRMFSDRVAVLGRTPRPLSDNRQTARSAGTQKRTTSFADFDWLQIDNKSGKRQRPSVNLPRER